MDPHELGIAVCQERPAIEDLDVDVVVGQHDAKMVALHRIG